jgi:hypothetical protein
MTYRRRALVVLAVVAVVVLAGLLTVGTWASERVWTRASGRPPHMMTAGDSRRVDSLAAARQRAQAYADRLGLRAGEVIEFSNGFYAELLTGDGEGATEVLVDRVTGAVGVEYGPAMMWNTSYGMMRNAARGMYAGATGATPVVSAVDAGRLAQRWLDDQRHGLTVGEPERFPGYYTFETLRGGKIDGMLSVNATTGAVWYHVWHGSFVAASEE